MPNQPTSVTVYVDETTKSSLLFFCLVIHSNIDTETSMLHTHTHTHLQTDIHLYDPLLFYFTTFILSGFCGAHFVFQFFIVYFSDSLSYAVLTDKSLIVLASCIHPFVICPVIQKKWITTFRHPYFSHFCFFFDALFSTLIPSQKSTLIIIVINTSRHKAHGLSLSFFLFSPFLEYLEPHSLPRFVCYILSPTGHASNQTFQFFWMFSSDIGIVSYSSPFYLST